MRYNIMAVSADEYAKADADATYVPHEYLVGTIDAECESEALRVLAKGIRTGRFPKGSQLTVQHG